MNSNCEKTNNQEHQIRPSTGYRGVFKERTNLTYYINSCEAYSEELKSQIRLRSEFKPWLYTWTFETVWH